MKVIFLDIDWVLIRFWDTKQIRKTRADKKQCWFVTDLDEDLVKNLVTLIEETNSRIVLSSSWRRHLILRTKLREQLEKVPIKVWALTTELWFRIIASTPIELWYWRWNEILTFIMNHNIACTKWNHITEWVAIDDDSWDMKSIKRLWRFVHTNIREWLTKEKMNEAINILNK